MADASSPAPTGGGARAPLTEADYLALYAHADSKQGVTAMTVKNVRTCYGVDEAGYKALLREVLDHIAADHRLLEPAQSTKNTAAWRTSRSTVKAFICKDSTRNTAVLFGEDNNVVPDKAK
jgi:hypothetical protein